MSQDSNSKQIVSCGVPGRSERQLPAAQGADDYVELPGADGVKRRIRQ